MIRRWTTGLLTVLLILLVTGWIFYLPPAALNTLKPVPAHAQIVYRSAAPGWFLSFFPTFGTNGAEVPEPWKKRFRRLEKSPLTAASVSLGGRDRRDSWVTVSALGPSAVFLSWQLKLFPPPGVQPSRSYGAWPVWQYSHPSLPVWARVRFSIAEGLLICAISEDGHDIEYLLDTFDGRRPSAAQKDER
jgi:hypothetical protein